MFKINNKDTRAIYLTPCSNVSIVNFKQINACWELYDRLKNLHTPSSRIIILILTYLKNASNERLWSTADTAIKIQLLIKSIIILFAFFTTPLISLLLVTPYFCHVYTGRGERQPIYDPFFPIHKFTFSIYLNMNSQIH